MTDQQACKDILPDIMTQRMHVKFIIHTVMHQSILGKPAPRADYNSWHRHAPI